MWPTVNTCQTVTNYQHESKVTNCQHEPDCDQLSTRVNSDQLSTQPDCDQLSTRDRQWPTINMSQKWLLSPGMQSMQPIKFIPIQGYWVDDLVDGRTDGLADGLVGGRTGERTDCWAGGLVGEQTDGQTGRQTDGLVGGRNGDRVRDWRVGGQVGAANGRVCRWPWTCGKADGLTSG